MNILSINILASAVLAGSITLAQVEVFEEPVAAAHATLERIDSLNKSQHIEAARIMHVMDGGRPGASAEELVRGGYLKEGILNDETLIERVNSLASVGADLSHETVE